MTAVPWPRLFIEALRLDQEPWKAVRRRARKAIEAGVGGFILFGGASGTVRDLCAELRGAAGHPLWLAADLERGAGQQFAGATELPPPRALAAHPRPEAAVRAAAVLTAREARERGLNWVFAPVLDLDVEPRNPIVGTRSFGADPEVVAELGLAWVEACQAEGVAACGKHFPGHGRTTGDSHLELPTVRETRERLEADLRPFRTVGRRVASVMTAHVAYPSLGADGAATFSHAVLTDLLRGELGFEGLVVTDALVMEGFRAGMETAGAPPSGGREAVPAPGGGEAAAAARALAAGCDLLLYPEDLAAAAAGLEVAADPALAARGWEAVRRSGAALARFPGDAPSAAGGGDDRRGGFSVPDGSEERGRLALELAVGCLRPRMPADRPAWSRGAGTEILWISDDDGRPARPPAEVLAEELRSLGWRIAPSRPLGEKGARGDVPGRRAGAAGGEGGAPGAAQRLVVVRSTPRAWKGRAGLPSATVQTARAAVREAPAALAVALSHERTLEELAVPGICAWAAEAVMERAVARWLDARAG